jgi:gliding motility associated protien GldN
VKKKQQGTAIPYVPIREEDALCAKTVWREIDLFEKQNTPFRYEGDENTGGGMFAEILIDAIKRGKVTAYSALGGDDRFTTQLTKEQVVEQVTPKPLEVDVPDVDGETVHRVMPREFDPHSISKLRIKEEWVFDRNEGKMITRIIGIAPVMDVYNDADGSYKGSYPVFWLSYPQLREVLTGYEVYNDQSTANRYTWDVFFDRHMFASKITKVTNPFNQRFDEIYGNDERGKMESLYEGQQYANVLFNEEHDKWEH